MATSTAGTNTTTRLPFALQFQSGGLSRADIASIAEHIKDDLNVTHPIIPSAFEAGKLFIPNRGFLLLRPGDWIAVGTTGWPVLVESAAMTADWTHS
jgi:hypothetical protein